MSQKSISSERALTLVSAQLRIEHVVQFQLINLSEKHRYFPMH